MYNTLPSLEALDVGFHFVLRVFQVWISYLYCHNSNVSTYFITLRHWIWIKCLSYAMPNRKILN